MNTKLKATPLYDFHISKGAKMAPFAGFNMPISYKTGIIIEHNWVREHAGIFDISHMGQFILNGSNASKTLSQLTPTNFTNFKTNKSKYTVLTNEDGGIIDDLIITKLDDSTFYLVLNAANIKKDITWINSHLKNCNLTQLKNNALIALQGPQAENIIQIIFPDENWVDMPFMTIKQLDNILITRSGYTGEDGFEITAPVKIIKEIWQKLNAHDEVIPIGLGARDSLRLEVGFPLYGHDLDDSTSPIEAGLSWVISKNHNGYIGEKHITNELFHGATRKRVGINLLGKNILREGTEILSLEGKKIGHTTSGGFSPTLKKAIAQGYVHIKYAKINMEVMVNLRGKIIPAQITNPAFIKTKPKKVN